ncbi:mechanosensitive ion channel family protein [Novosphingobium malaysiense]|uniref:Small-conductance mechanosensitive channel n=1 Tax=Novosphingobium malaysiense TaxID=1348853 RepID=A0A0B1ZQU9_9SPHN|nr:mechanosensitive ion channel family protein [Novosphingobium malaysiense]KHK91629.1 mechanosensitive ion channel protein MscS [Novosphingobium malaysiense]
MNYVAILRDELEEMSKAFVQTLPTLVIALVILFATWIVARVAVAAVSRITGRTTLRDDLKQLIDTLVRLVVWILGILIALTVAIPSFTPAGAFTSLGVGALAIGFAFQDIFENFLAGVLIMLREKMNIGDTIECEGLLGKVEKITLRETHIRQFSGELTVVPNSMLFKNPVEIYTDQPLRRFDIIVGVSYDTDLSKAQPVIQGAVESVEAVDKEKGVVVFAQEFNSSSVDFLVQWWTDTVAQDLRLTKSEVVMAVKAALDEAGIEIPFPYVTNTFKEPLSLQQVPEAANAA